MRVRPDQLVDFSVLYETKVNKKKEKKKKQKIYCLNSRANSVIPRKFYSSH